jgi:hypothetical protein
LTPQSERLLATSAIDRVGVGQRQGTGGMPRAGEVVKAHGGGQRNVSRALWSVWISEASPRQYSVDELVKKIFGTRRCAESRSSKAVAASSDRVNARRDVERKGVAHRWVKRGGRLPEALIEVATTLTADDVDEHAV